LERLGAPLAAAIEAALAAGREQLLPDSNPAGEALPMVAVLPLQARGRTFGVLALSREASRRHFHPSDLTMAEALLSRAASALDNALLFKELENADRQKNEFLSMLAHELRNPLAPIRSAVDVLRMGQHQDANVVWAQEVIDRQVTHLVKLVDELLDVSRITRGKIRLELATLDLAQVVRTAVETSQPLVVAARHQLTVSLPPGAIWIDADEARLSQVLANLLNNAAKYTPPGGSIRLTAARENGEAVIRVRDSGVGIAPEMLPRVFELFQQVEQSLDRSQGGLGIGLTLSRRLVEMHGGQIEAHSEGPGRGSEFLVRFPLASPPSAAPGDTDAPVVEGAGGGDARRVLVVDDNVDAAGSLARLLQLRSHVVHLAHDGEAALLAVERFRPEVVLLDLGLPRINGYEVARRLRDAEGDRKLLLIAVSGYGSDANRVQAVEAGFDCYFVKPLDVDRLFQALADGNANQPASEQALAGKA
jgi:signal transduction histidine kinase/ActR/RegA family two-component response regulator